ncbi:hypothetical protein GCM10010218_52570 [Streptomyces mashuensis]|uniref:SnoaL-like domain-containing protein n=1 Tax=Streptomyces mashuensis TaxID=33904 RepID=A0A919EFF1_9ACTN|nr:nuclear transport factor 2 family protein [Streptomyces mashuensis]GHF64491.1 hypothetical protein GCM10010218_52570 [Streptomyces mashuensis]
MTDVLAVLADEVAQLRREVRALTDKAAIVALVDRFVTGLDHPDPDFCDEDWFRSVFTEDVVLDLPNGKHHGVAGLPGFFRAPKLMWDRTHHFTANCVVETDGAGDRAVVRANVHATHVPHPGDERPLFTGGATYGATAVRTPDGWRLGSLTTSVVWIEGAPDAH